MHGCDDFIIGESTIDLSKLGIRESNHGLVKKKGGGVISECCKVEAHNLIKVKFCFFFQLKIIQLIEFLANSLSDLHN